MSDNEKDESVFAFNPNARISSVRAGHTPITVILADEVLLRPQRVLEFGLAHQLVEDTGNLYPGVRARLPVEFSRRFVDWLARALQTTDVLEDGCTINDDASYFSIVDKGSASLLPLQRIPHYDSADPRVFAAVIYLFDRAHSGTSFYRHRTTGYERIRGDTAQNYKIALNHNLRTLGPPAREYTNGSNALFERIHSVDSVFNRIVIYSGNALHAADIESSLFAGNKNEHWRFTITSLINSVAAR